MAKRGPKPFEFTETVLENVQKYAAQGNTLADISHNIGIHYDTFNEHKKKNPDITEALEKGKAQGRAIIINALFKKAQSGNLGAMCYWLNNKASDKWKNHHHIDETVRHIGLAPEIKSGMSPQEAAESYADTLRQGNGGNVIPIKRRK